MSGKKLNRIISLRYATALFDLAKQEKELSPAEEQLFKLIALIEESEDFAKLVFDQVISREEKVSAVKQISAKLKLTKLVNNFLCVLATKRRLYLLPEMVAEFNKLIAKDKGEVTAKVKVVEEMNNEQMEKLKELILSATGMKSVKLDIEQDKSIIGGLVIKVGSVVIDNSVRSKLDRMQRTLKETNLFSDTNSREVV